MGRVKLLKHVSAVGSSDWSSWNLTSKVELRDGNVFVAVQKQHKSVRES